MDGKLNSEANIYKKIVYVVGGAAVFAAAILALTSIMIALDVSYY